MEIIPNTRDSSASIIKINSSVSQDVKLKPLRDKIVIPSYNGFHIVSIWEILRLESAGNYTRMVMKNESEILISKTMKTVMNRLPERQFLRIHQSHILNVDNLKFIGKDKVEINNGLEFPIGRAYKKKISTFLEEFTI